MPSAGKVAVIGCGYWGRNLVRNFAQLGALAMVCDSNPQGRQLAASLAPGVRVVSDVREVFDAPVDAVAIASPSETHHPLALQALRAGKDALVEKPLALTYQQGAELVQTARDNQRILMVGHLLEYHPAIKQLINLIHGGELGQVYYLYSNRLSLGIVRREENILWSFAPHDIAVILRLLGQMPSQVVACGGQYLQPNIADVTITSLLFDQGVRAHLYVSWLHPFKEQRLVVIGSRKMASFDDVTKKLVLYDQRVEVKEEGPVPLRGEGEEIPFATDEPLRLECEAFLAALASRTPPVTDGASGLRVLEVLQAAQQSLTSNGEPVSLPIVESTLEATPGPTDGRSRVLPSS